MGGISSKRIPGLRCLRGPRKETGLDPLGPHRISAYIEAFALQQKCRVVHKRNAKLAAADAISRPWSGRRGDEFDPRSHRFDLRIGQVFAATGIGMLF
jgi:hypothetical protein